MILNEFINIPTNNRNYKKYKQAATMTKRRSKTQMRRLCGNKMADVFLKRKMRIAKRKIHDTVKNG